MFEATDRLNGTDAVNLRSGPGIDYPTRGIVAAGAPLAATGERELVGGVLWRRFVLPDGRTGWIRDIDVLRVR